MPSFTERYHELTKYNPRSIDKLGPVQWETQPPQFKDVHAETRLDLLPSLRRLLDAMPKAARGDGKKAGGVEGGDGADGADAVEKVNSLDGLTRLLFFTLGLTARVGQEGDSDFFLRAAPSAGGLYPTEMYVAVRNASDIPDGLYHYHSLRSALYPVWQGNFWADLRHYFLGQAAIETADVLLLFTGIYSRSAWRYKERAYRRILLDTGHAVGNLVEVCREAGWDYRLLGGFLDAGLEELFFLTPGEEFPLLGIAVGETGALPPDRGQRPGPEPKLAVEGLPSGEAMQVQQNHCERLRDLSNLRDTVSFERRNLEAPHLSESVLPLILKRRSCRKFNGRGIPVDEMKQMLAHALRDEGGDWRLAPGLVDLHVVVLEAPGLDAGVYALNPETLSLKLVRAGDFRQEAFQFCLGQELAADCAFLLVYTADMAALAAAYGDRGYRYACMDCGQIGERINLIAMHLGLGSSGIGGYYDDLVNESLNIPLSHGILYITVTGVPEE